MRVILGRACTHTHTLELDRAKAVSCWCAVFVNVFKSLKSFSTASPTGLPEFEEDSIYEIVKHLTILHQAQHALPKQQLYFKALTREQGKNQ